MKRKRKIVIPVIIMVLVLVAGIIFFKNYNKQKEQSEPEIFELDGSDINCIRIKYHADEYTITSKVKIEEIIGWFNGISVTEKKEKETLTEKIYGNKNFFKIYCYADKEGKDILYDNFTVYVPTEGEIEDFVLEGTRYEIRSGISLSEKLSKLIEYCTNPLPEVTVENFWKFDSQGYETELNAEEIFEQYQMLSEAVPIPEDEFQTSDTYLTFTTYDDEEITMYKIGEEIYLKYVELSSGFVAFEEDEIAYFKWSEG